MCNVMLWSRDRARKWLSISAQTCGTQHAAWELLVICNVMLWSCDRARKRIMALRQHYPPSPTGMSEVSVFTVVLRWGAPTNFATADREATPVLDRFPAAHGRFMSETQCTRVQHAFLLSSEGVDTKPRFPAKAESHVQCRALVEPLKPGTPTGGNTSRWMSSENPPHTPSTASGTFLQTLPDVVRPLKGHSLPLRSCPLTLSAPYERFGYR